MNNRNRKAHEILRITIDLKVFKKNIDVTIHISVFYVCRI